VSEAAQPKSDFPRYYANWVRPFGGLYDLTIDFGYNRQEGDEPEPEWLARIVLSWEEAVILSEALGMQIAQYEDQVGEIRRWGGEPPALDPGSNGNPSPEPDSE
jgi:hypothetical protein